MRRERKNDFYYIVIFLFKNILIYYNKTMPIDYNQSKIYKLVSNKSGKEWFNITTTARLCRRLGVHKLNYKKGNKQDKLLKEIMDDDDYYIEFVEDRPCKNKED